MLVTMSIVLLHLVFLIERVASVGLSTNHLLLLTKPSQSGESFFGFSHVFLPAIEESPPAIVVSAPRGSQDGDDALEPGVIWKCYFGSVPLKEGCHRMNFPMPNVSADDPCSRKKCEWNDGAWLGMTLTTGHKEMLVCAPKWLRSSLSPGNPRLNGLCHLVQDGQSSSSRLVPLGQQSMQMVDRYPIYSWGQAGFSASLTNNEILLGAPGINGWNGSVIRYDSTDINRFLVLDTSVIQLFYTLEYFGYAVTSGIYFDGGTQYSVAGAPRGSALYGSVFIFQFPIDHDEPWFPEVILKGDSFGSYFGSTLGSGDVNGDGRDDLVIGAPMRGSDVEVTTFGPGATTKNEGCIFLYTSKGRGQSFGRPEVICGSTSPGARFGAAIAFVGDINDDGFQDFAVGAPYEEDEGAVYIYHGRSTFGLGTSAPAQFAKQIRPYRDTGLKLTSFGVSIFGGVDLDENGTPDIGIGAFTSETLMILRTRRVVSLEMELLLTVNGSVVEELDVTNDEFDLRICPSTGQTLLDSSAVKNFGLEVGVEVTFDPSESNYEIVGSAGSLQEVDTLPDKRISQNGSTLSFKLDLYPGKQNCSEWKVQKKDAEDFNVSSEIKVHWKLSYSLGTVDFPGMRNYSLVADKLSISGESFDSFCPLCPEATATSGVTIFPLMPSCRKEGTCEANFDLDIFFPSHNQLTKSYRWLLGLPNLELIIQIHNGPQTVGNLILTLTWSPNWLTFSNVERYCTAQSSGIGLYCIVGTLDRNETTTIRMTLDRFYARMKSTLLQISAVVNSQAKNHSEIGPIEGKTKEAEIWLESEASVSHFAGSLNTITINENQSRIEFKQTFKMGLRGENGVEMSYNFWFPASFDAMPLISLYHPIGRGCIMNKEGLKQQKVETREVKVSKVLTCANPDVSCLHVTCPKRRSDPGDHEEFTFRFSLDVDTSRTLLNESGIASFGIQSKAELRLYHDMVHVTYALTTVVDPVMPVRPVQADTRLSLALILTGLIAGLLLFTLLCFYLLHRGFFKRGFKVPRRSKAKKSQNQDSNSDKERSRKKRSLSLSRSLSDLWIYSPVYQDHKLKNKDKNAGKVAT